MSAEVIRDRKTLRVVALVDLDDRTHSAQADRQRDSITKAVGYPGEPRLAASQEKRVIHANWLTALPELPAESFILTDSPYISPITKVETGAARRTMTMPPG